MASRLRIGTRGSRLALVQTDMVARALRQKVPALDIEVVEIKTSGDWHPSQGETRLAESEGGKGLFAREIEQALLEGRIDCGVHSLKDMPARLPDGLVIEHVLPRADAREAFLSNGFKRLDDLPPGARVGTSSTRRQAFLLARRPDVQIVPLRGNVPTRIEKLRRGQADAIFLAMAGLIRLGLTHEIAAVLEPEEMLPSGGQGVVGIEIRAGDKERRALFDLVHCRETGLCAVAERAALATLDGSCHTPIGAYAIRSGGGLMLRVAVAALDGSRIFEERIEGPVDSDKDADALGVACGSKLKARLPPDFLK